MHTQSQVSKTIHVFLAFLIVICFSSSRSFSEVFNLLDSSAQPDLSTADFVQNRILISYKKIDPSAIPTIGAAILNEHAEVANILKTEFQNIDFNYSPIHQAIVNQMSKGNLSEAALISKFQEKRNKLKAKRTGAFYKSFSLSQLTGTGQDWGLSRKLILEFNAEQNVDVSSLFDQINRSSNFKNSGYEIRASLDRISKETFVPNDPSFPVQWALNNTGQNGGTVGADVHAPQAWDITRGNPAVIVAVIDSGIDYNHQDLAANIWMNTGEIPSNGIDDDNNGYVDDVRGWDFVENASGCSNQDDCNTRDNDPSDQLGHGTHCAGIIAAVGNNALGISGIAPNIKVQAIRAGYKSTSGGGSLASSDIEPAIIYAVNNGADIISMSFGSPSDLSIQNELDYANNQGVILVAAAGNGIVDPNHPEGFGIFQPHYPAAYPYVIGVGALNNKDVRTPWSNYGPWVDIFSPGDSIYSTLPNNLYDYKSGTSMATPLVAGAAALVLSAHLDYSSVQVRNALIESTDDLGVPGWDFDYSSGRLNIYNALQRTAQSKATAQISYPIEQQAINGTINIDGTATDPEFDHFVVSYQNIENPSIQGQICSSYSQVSNSHLCSNVNTSRWGDQNVVLRLTVYNHSGGSSENVVIAKIQNLVLVSPVNSDVFGQSLINIQGQNLTGYANYSIEYGAGDKPTQWFSNGFTATNQLNGILGTLDPTQIPLTDLSNLTFKFTTHIGTNPVTQTIHKILVDPTMELKTPIRINHLSSTLPLYYSTTVEDLDGDGNKEIIISYTKINMGEPVDKTLKVFNFDGSLRWEAGNCTPIPSGERRISTFVIDMDGDHRPEIIQNCERDTKNWPQPYFTVYDAQGTIKKTQQLTTVKENIFRVMDLNHDGYPEFIVDSVESSVKNLDMMIYDSNLHLISRWDNASGVYSIAYGNFDEDNDLELVLVPRRPFTGLGIQIRKINGDLLPGWPVKGPNQCDNVVVGDLDHDEKEDIVLNCISTLEAYDRYGHKLTGWPVSFPSNIFITDLALLDYNFDGYLEIFAMSTDGNARLHLFNYSGSILPGWPKSNINFDGFRTQSASVADVNFDGVPDIVVGLKDSAVDPFFRSVRVMPFDVYGNILHNAEKTLNGNILRDASNSGLYKSYTVPILGDFNKDKNLDLLYTSDDDKDFYQRQYKGRASTYVWNMGPFDPKTLQWPMREHDGLRTNRYLAYTNQKPFISPIGNKKIYLLRNHFDSDNSKVLMFDISATDPDDDTILWTVVGVLPEGLKLADHGNGKATFTWKPTFNQIGTHTVTFKASDGQNTAQETISIEVLDSKMSVSCQGGVC